MNTKTKKLLKKIYIVVVLLGIVAAIFTAIERDALWSAKLYLGVYAVLIVGIYYFKRQIRMYNRMEIAVATVTDYREFRDSDNDLMYKPCLEFTVQGQVCSTCLWGSSDKRYKIGEKVNIRYNPDNPQKIEIDRDYDNGRWVNAVRAILLVFVIHAIVVAIATLSDAGYISEWLMVALIGLTLAGIGLLTVIYRAQLGLFIRIIGWIMLGTGALILLGLLFSGSMYLLGTLFASVTKMLYQ